MSNVIKLKKGLDIPIKGEPAAILENIPMPETFAIKPADFLGLVPKLPRSRQGSGQRCGLPESGGRDASETRA